ncbi:translation factor GUF1, mitochondrial [Alternaria panax]|uniref:Translation factor GUF1, mitochondrial n=1 Tax=Alternaria panax TaxID=48097 RepID=A0AAD4FHQ8_9PLEO|nr:translation factor GUF1, mitochondrial [Alternaria panax]
MTPSTALAHSPSHRRHSSRSGSVSSSSLHRSASLRDPSNAEPPHKRATPPPSTSRRRSSAANGAADGIAPLRDGPAASASLTSWSQSQSQYHSNATATRDQDHHHHHHHHPSFSRKLSITTTSTAANASAPLPQSPSRSPPSSPRRHRPRSPVYDPPSSVTAPPNIPELPPILLPSTVYDPNTPTSTSTTNNSPSASSLFTPSLLSGNQPRDYFNSQPTQPPPAQRPPSRTTKAERVLGRSPLASPAVLQEADSTSGPGRPSTGRRPSIAAAPRDTAPKPLSSAGHRQAASRDHSRSQSREQFRSASRAHARSPSRDHLRSESNASARLDDGQQGTPPRTRERREKDKKTMLSRALQKANTAVLLDNAQNFEGAMEAYEDACKLLQQVMIRSSQEEDRRKLDAIRVTYTNRIEELRRLDPGYTNHSGKSLPARPMSGESLDEHRSMLLLDDDDDEQPAVIETATVSRIVNDRSIYDTPSRGEPTPPLSQQLPLRKDFEGPRESVISTAIRDVQRGMQNPQFNLQPPPGRLAPSTSSIRSSTAESLMDRVYMPPPLSPKRSKSPLLSAKTESEPGEYGRLLQPQQPVKSNHQRVHSNESTSWLDTIDESGGSPCSSSVHSMSPGGVRRKHLRNTSGGTEAEFDAALDAAVEAAYDDGYEPYDDDISTPADLIATKLRNVELAKERVREAEREEAIAAAKYRYKETQLRSEGLPHVRESAEIRFNDEADEEERLLDEMTREYMLDGFDFDLQTKSALPRQSDSSGFSGSTYNSSVSSHRTTGGTSLSTVVEVIHPTSKQPPVHHPPPVPAPSGALPALPSVPESQASQPVDTAEVTPRPTTATKDAASVRSRRLSGQNAKSLKIETSVPPVPPAPHTEKPLVPAKDTPTDLPAQPKSAAPTFSTTKPALDSAFKIPALPQASQQSGLRAPSPQPALYSPAEIAANISPATPALSHAVSNDAGLVPGSPKNGKTSAMGIRKNKSSLSLKQRNLSISSPDGSDASVGTPLSTTFSITGRKPSNAGLTMPTPSIPTFNVDGLPSGGMHLFESDIHSPFSPGSPSPAITNAPIPLEPCPDAYLLRPFWLMRCFYQTIAHPRGGYLSTKLFIPRDVWRVKGVKLKNIEDKIANCDMLTAALQKLASVDMNDADAVLEEMQSLESVLDQVQTQLAKKLGNEVGVHSVTALFRDATTVGEGATSADSVGKHGSQDHAHKGAVAQGKSYLASWRKLRSKNSGVNLAGMAGGAKSAEVPKDTLVMSTLPMTNLPSIRFAKRDISGLGFEGPNAGYMDQIARQVEDPGLKHSSPTHVGLELSTRHAAEFFGFYICRFVLADVTMMLDKFIKRGSEWVLV